MNKKEFLYKFLVNYNVKEKSILKKYNTNINDSWIKNDTDNEQNGLMFYILRNMLAHDTEETLNNFIDYFEYKVILDKLDSMIIEGKEKIKLLEFILNSSKVVQELERKGFEKYENLNDRNVYYCYQRTMNNLFFDIFLHVNGNFITYDISTYNHLKNGGEKNYYKVSNIYIETEQYFDKILLKLFKYQKGSVLPNKLYIYLDKNKKSLEKAISEISYSEMSNKLYVEHKYIKDPEQAYTSSNNLIFYNNIEAIKEYSDKEFDWTIVTEIYTEVITQFKTVNQILQKIGLQL